MTCRQIGAAIACGPPTGVYKREIMHCPECDRRHRFVVRWDGAWYGTTLYGSCGDKWSDGFRHERPFQRGWRKKAQARFRAMWANACTVGAYQRYVDADCGIYDPTIRTNRQQEKAFRRRAVALELIRRKAAV